MKLLKKNIKIVFRYPFYYGYYDDGKYKFPLNARYCKTAKECMEKSKRDIELKPDNYLDRINPYYD